MGIRNSLIWSSETPLYGHQKLSYMGIRNSLIWASETPLYGLQKLPYMGIRNSLICTSETPLYGHQKLPYMVIRNSLIWSSETPLYGHQKLPYMVIRNSLIWASRDITSLIMSTDILVLTPFLDHVIRFRVVYFNWITGQFQSADYSSSVSGHQILFSERESVW